MEDLFTFTKRATMKQWDDEKVGEDNKVLEKMWIAEVKDHTDNLKNILNAWNKKKRARKECVKQQQRLGKLVSKIVRTQSVKEASHSIYVALNFSLRCATRDASAETCKVTWQSPRARPCFSFFAAFPRPFLCFIIVAYFAAESSTEKSLRDVVTVRIEEEE